MFRRMKKKLGLSLLSGFMRFVRKSEDEEISRGCFCFNNVGCDGAL